MPDKLAASRDDTSIIHRYRDHQDGTFGVMPAGNFEYILLTHTAAAAGVTSATQANLNSRGLQFYINISAGTGTLPTLQVFIEGVDVAGSGLAYTLLASVVLVASAALFTQLTVYPGVAAAANVMSNQPLPRFWRVRTVIGGTTPTVTATIGASLIL